MYTDITYVYRHYVCIQALCMYTGIMYVYRHYVCIQALCMYTGIMVSEQVVLIANLSCI